MRIQWITGCILRRSIRGSGSGSGIDDFRLPRRVTLSTSYICDRFYQFGGVPGGYDELSIDQLPGKLMITKTAEKKAMTLIEVKGKGVVSQAIIQPKCKGMRRTAAVYAGLHAPQ